MRLVRDITEDEMIEAFVLAEVKSTRFGANYAYVAAGDTTLYEGDSVDAKGARRFALAQIRGYGTNRYLFTGFPTNASWKLMAVPRRELEGWLYAHEDTWLALSHNSRVLRDGAANVGKVAAVADTSDNILAVESDVRSGKRYPPVIAAAVSETSPHILAEGHTRATAYVRALDADDEIEVIVGYSADLPMWRYYGTPASSST
jgi:hypothetical protein